MAEYKHLRVERDEGIRLVTISRPEALNALNREVLDELKDVFSSPGDGFEVVIITGEGKAFVAGADIGEMRSMDSVEATEFSRMGQEVFSLIESYPWPTIAAINGYALGGGLELALACDIRVASEKAKMGQPEVNLAVIPGFGGTQRLPRLIGPGRAFDLLYTGKMVSAGEALSMGLVNAVFSPEELLQGARKIASEILKKGPEAIRTIKWLVRKGLDVPLEDGLIMERLAFGRLFSTSDQKEGMAAFLQKRAPEFTGK
ncbi:MAG: enoyl-CoA hydratase/isomerase family protein [Thermoplasmata archaeon]|nr:enoyl-CoA hydratase/isomerase family protein [Thermoplasmata archaeon]